MPTYVSKLGLWEPAKEYVVDPNAPKGKEIYEGPDRAALEAMEEAGLYDSKTGEFKGSMGQDIRDNQEMMDIARGRGYQDVEEYLTKRHGWNKEKFESEATKKQTAVNEHKNPVSKEGIKELGGGIDKSGSGQHRMGGFELPSDAVNAPRLTK